MTTTWPQVPGSPVSKALADSAAPVAPESHTPVTRITSPVVVQMRMVSTNTSKIPYMPWRTGWSVVAAACTMGALPRPASLENRPRAMP